MLALHLILHELATNAVKHGALSQSGGRVEVRWDITEADGRTLQLVWREEGGPPVRPPVLRSFGTRLIEHAARSNLGGGAELNFAPEGLKAVITMPLI